MATRQALAELLVDADLETAQQVCKKKKRSLNLDKLVEAARVARDPLTREWLARRAMDAPPAKKKPRWARRHAVAISGSMEDLETTLEEGDDWFVDAGALGTALRNGFGDVVTRVLEEMPDTDRARNVASTILANEIHSTRRPFLPALLEAAPCTHRITQAAALRDEAELFDRGLEAEGVDAGVVGALITCERRYAEAVVARPGMLAAGASGGAVWSNLARSVTGRWSPPRPEHTSDIAFLSGNLEFLIRAGLTPDAAAVHAVLSALDPTEYPEHVDLTLSLVEVMVEVAQVDLNVEVHTGERWSAADEGYVEVSEALLEAALVRMPLAVCKRLHELGARLDGSVRVAQDWSEREEKRTWLESIGSTRESTCVEVLGDGLSPDVDYATLAALLFVDPEGVGGVRIGMHEDEVVELGFQVRDEWVSMEAYSEGSGGSQTFEVGFTEGVVDQIKYELMAEGPERLEEARGAFAAAQEALHGKARGTKNMTWRYGRTKLVLNAKSVTYGWETEYRMRVSLSEI